MEHLQYLAILRRWWWLLLASVVLGGAAAYGVSKAIDPTYEATTTLLVSQQEDNAPNIFDLQASERLANTFARLILLDPILEEAATALGDGTSARALDGKLSVTNPATTQLLELSARDRDPARAQLLANTVAEAFINSSENEVATRPGTVTVVERAQVPSAPVAPRTTLNMALGGIVALFLAAGVVLLIEYLDDTIKTPHEVSQLTGLPVIGNVGRFRRGTAARGDLQLATAPQSDVAEAYRAARTSLSYAMRTGNGDRVMLVTSSRQGEGKTTTVGNLAVAFGLGGHRVVVLDADLRRPRLHEVFSVGNTAGLATALLDEGSDLDREIQETAHDNVWIMPTGPLPPNPAELLGTERMVDIVDELRERFDLVLIDTPPVLLATDAAVLARLADLSMIVVFAGKTRTHELSGAVQALAQAGRPIVGAVLNRVRAKDAQYGGYGGYYTQHEGEGRGSSHTPRRAADRSETASVTPVSISTPVPRGAEQADG